MRFRFLNRLYANLSGYFWLPCPLCGKMFGGHEVVINTKYSNSIATEKRGFGQCICPDCTFKGLGHTREKIGWVECKK